METDAERVGDAPVANSQTRGRAQTGGGDNRSSDKLDGHQHESFAFNAHAANRFPEDEADHRFFYGSDVRTEQGNRGDGCGYLFADRHVDFRAGRGTERGEESLHSCVEVTWNG